MDNTFHKSERLCSKKAIEALFEEGSSNIVAFPLRAVYRSVPQPGVRVMISVSKHKFRHAVDRNRVKRQIRESYRLNKHIILSALESDQSPVPGMDIAFLWLSNTHQPSRLIEKKVVTVLQRIVKSLFPEEEKPVSL